MGIKPKFNVGDWVIDPDLISGSESLVLIKSRIPVLEDLKPDWNYSGEAYEIKGNPLALHYKTTVTARESKFVALSSRIVGP